MPSQPDVLNVIHKVALVHSSWPSYVTTRGTVRDLEIALQAAEQIVVLEQGQVREVGTHDELVKRNGVYADLVSSTSLSLSTSVWYSLYILTDNGRPFDPSLVSVCWNKTDWSAYLDC